MKFLNLSKSLLILAASAMTTIFVSCSGEDGSDGTDGVGIVSTEDNGDGTFTITYSDGSTFTSGDLTGDTGNDGNANVSKIVIDISETIDNTTALPLIIPELTKEVLQNNTLIFYLEDTQNSIFAPIPGGVSFYDRRYNVAAAEGIVELTITNFDGTDLGAGWIPDSFHNLHITLIENPSDSETGKSSQDVIAILTLEGVDINDYRQVMQYFGLEE